jgi:PAS domain S-box-containing protein
MTGSYDHGLVAFSVLIAMFASYAALDLAGRVTAASGWTRSAWLTGGAAAMGFGIWSMHYIGMLAFHLPVSVAYHWPTVLVSLLAAIFASAVTLYLVSRQKVGWVCALSGSVVIGGGIAAMHYIGMSAMRLAAVCRFAPALVALSSLLAILISFVALWLALHFRKDVTVSWQKIAGAIVLGAAIPVMHYTGMAAARFIPSQVLPNMSHAVSISSISTAGIAIVTLMVLGLAVLTSFVDRRFYAQALELAFSEERYRQLFERSLAGVYRSTLDGHMLTCNDAFSRVFGYGSGQEYLSAGIQGVGRGLIDREFVAMLQKQKTLTNFERCLRRRDHSAIWVLENATIFESHDRALPIVEGTLIDITARKLAETELREANSLLEARQREIEEELSLAARVQQSLMPSTLIWGDILVDAFYHPVRTIGGDFGLVAPRADYLSLLVCDVSGHGISSALIANRIYTETISQIEQGVALGLMMRHLNHFVKRNLGSSEFYFTLSTVRLNVDGRSLEFAGAGHPPAMIVHPGQPPRLLESRSAVLGLLEDAVDDEPTIDVTIEQGDRIVIYTDGFTESFNPEGEMLGVDGFREIVGEAAKLSLPRMKQEIIDRVAAWRNGGPGTDDMSLVVAGTQ